MILDTNALSAWAEGLAAEAPLRSADRLVVLGEFTSASADPAIAIRMRWQVPRHATSRGARSLLAMML